MISSGGRRIQWNECSRDTGYFIVDRNSYHLCKKCSKEIEAIINGKEQN